MKRSLRGFTLIELLIVVAIIAILAAIAVPNFLEAQIRSKVSRAKADMRTLAVGMESYFVDNNLYPPGNSFGVAGFVPAGPGGQPAANQAVLEHLSSPIAYLTTAFFTDPFIATKRSASVIGGTPPLTATMVDLTGWTATPVQGDPQFYLYQTYLYSAVTEIPSGNAAFNSTNAGNLSKIARVTCNGTDPKAHAWIINSAAPMQALINSGGVLANWKMADCVPLVYDPTNGTVSFGNVWRVGGSPNSQDNIFGAVAGQK